MEQPKFSYLFRVYYPAKGKPKGAVFLRTSLSKKISKQSRIIHAMTTQLVELAEVERLSSVVIRVLGGNPGKVCILSFL